jgi:hypothetical protein
LYILFSMRKRLSPTSYKNICKKINGDPLPF